MQQERDALLWRDAEPAQRMGETDAAVAQLGIGQRAVGIDESELVAAAARHMGVDKIADGVVGAALVEIVRHARPRAQLSNSRVSSRRASTPATRRR